MIDLISVRFQKFELFTENVLIVRTKELQMLIVKRCAESVLFVVSRLDSNSAKVRKRVNLVNLEKEKLCKMSF